MTDLILKGGRLIDPASGRDETADIAFAGNYIFLGNYYGLQVWDMSNPKEPTLRAFCSDTSVPKIGASGVRACPRTLPLRSTTLTVSPPELATYKVLPSGVRARDLGSWPTLTGASNWPC